MSDKPLFVDAFPYQKDVLALPIENLDESSKWYSESFGMSEVSRTDEPIPRVILERDGTRIGFSINGGDATQDGAAILVSDIHRAREELESRGVEIANWRVDERDGEKLQVFFVIAPDGLCHYFHQPIGSILVNCGFLVQGLEKPMSCPPIHDKSIHKKAE